MKLLNILKKYNHQVFMALVGLSFGACVKENQVPAYVTIPAFALSTTVAQGSASEKITDAWVYVDGTIQGIYPLPNITFPVLELGNRTITVFPGIRNNGTRSNPIIYPFYTAFEQNVVLESGKTITLNPTTTYITRTRFWQIEDFEVANSFNSDIDRNPALRFSNVTNGFEGKSGYIVVDKTTPQFEKASTVRAQLPNNSENIFIELNYRTEAFLTIGVIGSGGTQNVPTTTYKITLKPTDTWNKTYLNVTQEVKDLQATDFQIVIKGVLPDSASQARVWIDNVKLIQK